MQDCRVMSACKPSQSKRAAEFQMPIAGAHLAAKVPILILCHAGKRGLRLNPHLLHLPHFQLLQAQSASRQLNVCSRLFHIMYFMRGGPTTSQMPTQRQCPEISMLNHTAALT